MDKLNTPDKRNHKRYNSWRKLGYALVLAGLLDMNTPTYAQTNTQIKDATEQVQPQIDKAGIQIPNIYQEKLDEFLKSNNVMKDNDAKNFTEDFISKEIGSDRGITKENQLLFIRHSIYKQITNQDLYDGKDNDSKISEDFNNKLVNIRIRACGQKYKNGITSYMNELSAEADKRISEADKRISEADKRISEADKRISEADKRISEADKRISEADKRISEADKRISEADSDAIKSLNNALTAMIDFYNSYNISPDPKRLESFEPKVKRAISLCRQYNIDYKAKLSNEMLKFYGIE